MGGYDTRAAVRRRARPTLTEPAYAFSIFGLWAAAVPLLVVGLSRGLRIAIGAAAGTLAAAVVMQTIYAVRVMRHACVPGHDIVASTSHPESARG